MRPRYPSLQEFESTSSCSGAIERVDSEARLLCANRISHSIQIMSVLQASPKAAAGGGLGESLPGCHTLPSDSARVPFSDCAASSLTGRARRVRARPTRLRVRLGAGSRSSSEPASTSRQGDGDATSGWRACARARSHAGTVTRLRRFGHWKCQCHPAREVLCGNGLSVYSEPDGDITIENSIFNNPISLDNPT
jgi:hypothetical protein